MSALGPGQDPHAVLQELSNELMSPYCPGRTIAACPSDQARKLEDQILAQARAGKTREEIEADLVGRFGSEIVGYAPPTGVLYGSILVGLVALVLIVVTGRRWSRRRAPAGGPLDAASRSAAAGDVPIGRGEGAVVRPPTAAERDALEDALDDEAGF